MKLQLSTLLSAAAVTITQSTKPQTATPSVLANLQWFAEYSAAAYCSANYLVPFNGTVICPKTVCPLLPTVPSVQLADSFIKVSYSQTTGLIMLDHTNKLIIVSFRGTHTTRDWLTDLSFLLSDAGDICKGCQAHSGFLDSWRGVRNIVLNEWNALRANYSSYQTVAVGHSLGGALAALCAAQMKTSVPNASVYLFTYGSPRVGNEELASYIETVLGWRNFRVTHLNDPVPRLPGRALGFAHPGPEYSITSPHFPGVLSANTSTLEMPDNLIVEASDILVLPGPESKMGNYGYACTNPGMHSTYFGVISGCLDQELSESGMGWTPFSIEKFALTFGTDYWEGLCGDFFLCC